MPRIVVMSDTHMLHHMLDVPDGDIVVHCGDWSSADEVAQYEDFFAWYSALPHRYKILVAGNHESLMSGFGKLMRRKIPSNIAYLEDARTTIQGLKFWGSPRTVGFQWMAFTHRKIDRPERIWAAIPDDTDVLVTHGPPHGILDRNHGGQHIGDRDLLERVQQIRPRLHLFGHVHDSNGELVQDGTHFINAAIGDDDEDPDLSARIHVVNL